MRKRLLAGALTAAVVLGAQAASLQMVQAAEVRVEETAELLAEAVDALEEDGYVEGEALVSLEAADAVALTKEGAYRYDSDVQVESVTEFGEDEETGKTKYIVHLTSDKYTAEELMEIALKQYYVDGVSANQYQHLYATDTDSYAASQWYLDGSGTDSAGIQLSGLSVTNRRTPVIAVIDTGVNYNHEDLADSMWVNPYPSQLAGTYGYDFGDGDSDPMDYYGHGTHVAGIAAATQNNGVGITGVSDAKIMALKVVPDDSTDITDAAIISAFGYVYDAMVAGVNVKAINCSWGGATDSNGLIESAINAVGALGALTVFAAGNDAVDWDNVRTALTTPYDLNSPYTIIVGASNEQDAAASYSDYGATSVDLFAPGSLMLSAYTEDVYLTGIYDETKREALSVYYNQCSSASTNILPSGQTYSNIYTAAQIGISTSYTVSVTTETSGGNSYLKLNVSRSASSGGMGGGMGGPPGMSDMYDTSDEVAGSIYVDVTDLNLSQSATYYVSYMYGAESGSELCWESDNMVSSAQSSRFVTVDDKTYMRIVGLTLVAGDSYTFYLDDIAISVANPDTSQFGEYVYMNGTSMAAPVVSGALAALAAANPRLKDAKTLRSLLLTCVRTQSSLSNKCVTGGIIDMSKLCTLAVKVKLNKTSATLAYGKTLTLKATVTPSYATSTAVTWKSSNTKYATVSSKGVVTVKKAGIGHTVKITATAADGSGKKAVCKIKLTKK